MRGKIPDFDFDFVVSHDNAVSSVDGQLLGYSIDAVNDYAIVSDYLMMSFRHDNHVV